MKIIAGLGNPENKYAGTRHNVGFEVIDRLARELQMPLTTRKFKGQLATGFYEGEKIMLLCPLTYMNLSGECIQAAAAYYNCSAEDVIVICDDINLDVGNIRIRKKGSAGGHNGLKNIILHLGSEEFARVRIGVGEKPSQMDLVDFVLGHFEGEAREKMDDAENRAAKAVLKMLKDGPDAAMNEFNFKKEKKPKNTVTNPEETAENTSGEKQAEKNTAAESAESGKTCSKLSENQ